MTSALEVVYTNLRDSKAQIFGSALCIILLFTLIMGFHPYQLDQSISVLRDVGWYFSFLSKL